MWRTPCFMRGMGLDLQAQVGDDVEVQAFLDEVIALNLKRQSDSLTGSEFSAAARKIGAQLPPLRASRDSQVFGLRFVIFVMERLKTADLGELLSGTNELMTLCAVVGHDDCDLMVTPLQLAIPDLVRMRQEPFMGLAASFVTQLEQHARRVSDEDLQAWTEHYLAQQPGEMP